jgi:SAM-dependent methyltransferase
MLTWEQLDWSILDRLRERFLQGGTGGPYWENQDDLAHYDFTYAERIGWKWDAVLGELKRRGWEPPAGPVIDWACGSGVAGRRVAAAWPGRVTALRLSDHSAVARDYATARAKDAFPDLDVAAADAPEREPVSTLVVSHVLNELDALGRGALAALLERARAVLWVEPGTSDVARTLVAWRERWRPLFRFILPCPHQNVCGLLAPGNERHWCHHFAPPPSGIFADSNWVRFGQRAGIDLRSLPYSVLVMERQDRPESAPLPAGASRIVGRPETFKPYARLLNCDTTGVQELTLPKRTNPALFRRIDRPDAPRLWQWERDERTIRRATPLDPRSGSHDTDGPAE